MRVLLFLLIIPFYSLSQTHIQDIRNDSGVLNYIRAVGHEYFAHLTAKPLPDITFELDQNESKYRPKMDKNDLRFADSVRARRWFLSDFDGDKLEDLVFYGKIAGSASVYVFFNGPSRKVILLADRFADFYPHSIQAYKIGNANGIIVGTLEQPEWDASQHKTYAQRFFHDTLVYAFGGFVEYNKNVQPGPVFDSIQFRPLSNWAGNNNWYMQIYRDGSVNYFLTHDTLIGRKTEFITKKMVAAIDPEDCQQLLDYIGFSQLSDSFYVKNISDQTVGLTTVYFSNGRKKTVWDYGMSGTYGLETLYARMRHYIDTAQWRVVASRKGYLGYKGEF